MANIIKNQQDILSKLNIHELNPLKVEAIAVIEKTTNTILLSPTGTGKTLAFLLPLIETLDPNISDVQVLLLILSRVTPESLIFSSLYILIVESSESLKTTHSRGGILFKIIFLFCRLYSTSK